MSIPVGAYVAIVYVIGYFVTPFILSLTARRPVDDLDMTASFFIALLWPAFLFGLAMYIWWVFCSTVGAKTRDVIKRKLERAARDD